MALYGQPSESLVVLRPGRDANLDRGFLLGSLFPTLIILPVNNYAVKGLTNIFFTGKVFLWNPNGDDPQNNPLNGIRNGSKSASRLMKPRP
jgi:hypothetical protein